MRTNNPFGNPGAYQQRNPFDDIKRFFKNGSMLSKLMAYNIIVWLSIAIIGVFAFLFGSTSAFIDGFITKWFAVPADLSNLAQAPWTLFTYMFLHIDFFHILFNMLWLYWFGSIFTQYLTKRQLLNTYIIGGLAGSALYILAFNIFPAFSDVLPFSRALGASASVMAIVAAISFYVPDYNIQLLFIGRIKLLYFALIYLVMDFLMIKSGNAGGHIAHLGGALYGIAFAMMLRKGKDLGSVMNFQWFRKMFYKPRMQAKPGNNQDARPKTDDEYSYDKAKQQQEIDRILDKIAKSGYSSLTREEKDKLFNVSKK